MDLQQSLQKSGRGVKEKKNRDRKRMKKEKCALKNKENEKTVE